MYSLCASCELRLGDCDHMIQHQLQFEKSKTWTWHCCKDIMSLTQRYPGRWVAARFFDTTWIYILWLPFCRVTSASGSTLSDTAPSGLQKCKGPFGNLPKNRSTFGPASDNKDFQVQLLLRWTAWDAMDHAMEFSHWNKCPHTSSSWLDCQRFCHGLSIRIKLKHTSSCWYLCIIALTASQFYLR